MQIHTVKKYVNIKSLKQNSTKALYQGRLAEKVVNNPITNGNDAEKASGKSIPRAEKAQNDGSLTK